MGVRSGNLTLDELNGLIDKREIDTVLLAFPDMQGRLVGKRVSARLFQDEVAAHGAEACNYLIAVDVEMNTVGGYTLSSWETGYGDMVLRPDFDSLRLIPWLPGTAMVMADLTSTSDEPLIQSPREVLRTQLARLEKAGLTAFVGTRSEEHRLNSSHR